MSEPWGSPGNPALIAARLSAICPETDGITNLMAQADRSLQWDGLINGRDLGGLALGDGKTITSGRLVRSASPHTVTAVGWEQAVAYGVRSTLDLRHAWEVEKAQPPLGLLPPQIEARNYSVEPANFIDSFRAAAEDWKLATPLYYDDFATDWGHRLATALQHIVDAPAGTVLLHCFAGRDRAGMIVAIVLDLLGASHQTIIDDHWLSFDRNEDIEKTLDLGTISGGILPLQKDAHADIMGRFLATNPAERALGHRSGQLRASLLRRLTADG